MPQLSEPVAKALSKSKVAWLVLSDEQTIPVWYASAPTAAYVVGGPGEQPLPELPATLRVILRDKDTRAAVGPVDAWPVRLEPGTDRWEQAADALLAARQNNPPGGLREHWAAQCSVWSIELTTPPVAIESGPAASTGTGDEMPPASG